MTETVYINNVPDPRRNINRYWLSGKDRDIAGSRQLDEELEAWVWSNQDYHRGLIVVDTFLGFTWGKYPGTPEGVDRMKRELAGRRIFETYEIDDDFHIKLWGQVPPNKRAPVPSPSRRYRRR